MNSPLPSLIEPAQLEAVLGDPELLIVDLSQPQTYARLHVPGALHVNPAALVCGLPPAPGKLPSPAQLRALFSGIGYRADRHVVIYDDEGGGWAGRFAWTLEVIGHHRYSLLDGGLHSWVKERHPCESRANTATPSPVELVLHPDVIAELSTVLAALGDPAMKIWDARSREEYLGLRSGSLRAGHIPGAVNLDWLELMDPARNLRLKPLPTLRAQLDALGIHPGHTIITHCQSHHRSGLTWFAAKLLGFKALGYHGSWAEWGNHPDVPIETTV
jgi:thiosulfate/3-mercaptopyruvate sulfurtransferase